MVERLQKILSRAGIASRRAAEELITQGRVSVNGVTVEELGATVHEVQASNRRFRDDEFLLPVDLTRGRSSIRVRLRFTPVRIPLFPGHPLPELAWSEIRYTADCWVLPPDPNP